MEDREEMVLALILTRVLVDGSCGVEAWPAGRKLVQIGLLVA